MDKQEQLRLAYIVETLERERKREQAIVDPFNKYFPAKGPYLEDERVYPPLFPMW